MCLPHDVLLLIDVLQLLHAVWISCDSSLPLVAGAISKLHWYFTHWDTKVCEFDNIRCHLSTWILFPILNSLVVVCFWCVPSWALVVKPESELELTFTTCCSVHTCCLLGYCWWTCSLARLWICWSNGDCEHHPTAIAASNIGCGTDTPRRS